MELAYRNYGEGQPLIILHGLFGQSDNWNTLAKRFAGRGFNTYTIDQRNHGLSPHSDEWTFEAMAADLKEFIERHQLQRPILLGHSMGGKTVMFFELLYSGIAAKIIVADIAPRSYERHHDDVLKALNAVDFKTIKNRRDAEAIMNQYISDFGTKQFLLKNIYWKEGTEEMAWRFNLKTMSAHYDNVLVEVPLATSDIQALFMRGERSEYITEGDLPDIAYRFPNYHLVTIPNAGHWIHAEQPDIFFDEVIKFIQ